MSEELYTQAAQVARAIARVVIQARNVGAFLKWPGDLYNCIIFTGSNLSRAVKEDSGVKWETTAFIGLNIVELSHATSKLIWCALYLGRLVNRLRQASSLPVLDWEREAKQIDIELRQEYAKHLQEPRT